MEAKKRIYFDRTEVFLVLGLIVLRAGLMFSLGMLVASGLNPKNAVDASHHSDSEKTVAQTAHGVGRKPASAESASNNSSNGKLKAAYQQAKQKALVDMALRESAPSGPKSVLDEKAHFEANSEWGRKPASQEMEPLSKSAEITQKAQLKSAPNSVKNLFERSPTSKDNFEPVPGTYTVQIASYATQDESQAKVAVLRKSGFNQAYDKSVKLGKGDTWYRVAVGSFPTSDWAKKTGQQLVRRKLATDFVVRRVE